MAEWEGSCYLFVLAEYPLAWSQFLRANRLAEQASLYARDKVGWTVPRPCLALLRAPRGETSGPVAFTLMGNGLCSHACCFPVNAVWTEPWAGKLA